MNAVIYYSNTNESKSIAQYLVAKLGYPLLDIFAAENCVWQNAVLVFPVYCQNIPQKVKKFLSCLKADNFAAIATYGKMSYGNVLYEIQKKYHKLVAAAYVPTKHAYIDEERFCLFDKLDVIANKFDNPQTVTVPKARKNPFANVLKKLRGRLGVKIIKDNSKCDGCGICAKMCDNNAVACGKFTNKCIRCMKCTVNCPRNALSVRLSPVMKKYLAKPKCTDLKIYI
ncbi:MAG: 4Fe-4S binding protein [Corallococcus sp.]|nr:4Fe-4S binding protein [Corallococcus sp.]